MSDWTASGLDAAQLSQHARLITLQRPETAQFANDALVVERFSGLESVNALFDFQIDVLATSSAFDPFALVGEELSLRLRLADGRNRTWHGELTAADALGGDGGLARYRLHLQPWLAGLDLRRDSFVYVNKSVREIVTEIFTEHQRASYAFEVRQSLARRPTCVQYRESDLAFVRRLLAEEGLSFRFDHEQEDGASSSSDGGASPSRHRLVIFDMEATAPDCPLSPIRFHRVDATEASDTITHWSARRQVTPTQVQRSAWDHATLQAPVGSIDSSLDLGEIPVLEHHEGSGAQRYTNSSDAADAAARALRAHESRIKRYRGQGSVRQLAAGQRFELSEHARYGRDGDGQRFVALAVRHEATNNLGAQAAQVLHVSEFEKGSYRNTFEAQPDQARIVPLWRVKPTAPESMVALVTGLGDDESPTAVHTQRDHRVQVRFHWQARRASDVAHAREHNRQGSLLQAGRHTSTGSSVWLRVATAMAGPNWGGHHLPRVGTEVLLNFIENDIDRPVVACQLHNARDLPPWSAGVDSDANHPGVLSGWHSRSLDGSGFNQWIADDTSAQVRTRLASSNAASQLNLGHLNAQAPESATRGAWRGTGAELRSDAWVVARAGEGLLLSTVGQSKGQGTVQDTASARGQMAAARQAAEQLSQAATDAQGLGLKANALLQPLIDDLDPERNGHYPATVNGQRAQVPEAGSREGTQPVPSFARPLIVLDANTSLNLATPASTQLYAGEAIHWTSQQQAHLAAGKTVSLASGRSAGLYTAEGGIQAIAQAGQLSVQAHTDALEWLAKDDFTVTSSEDEIHVLAANKVTLQGGQTCIELDGANITLTMPGLFDVKGVGKTFVGPKAASVELPALPEGELPTDTLYLDHRYHDDDPVAGAKYVVKLAGGGERTGVLDGQGRAHLDGVAAFGASVSFGPAEGAFKRKDSTPTPAHDPDPDEGKLRGLVDKYYASPEASGDAEGSA